MSKQNPNQEDEVWYIHVSNETRGPVSVRDLDVLLRTKEINSRTLGWREGMLEWKVLNQIEQIKESILQSSKQILQINKKRQSLLEKGNFIGKKLNGDPEQNERKQGVENTDVIIENKDQNPLTILEATVQNLLKQSFHQSEDGKWNIYDETKKQWVKQDEEPIEQIQVMKVNLFNKLKNQLFFVSDKNTRRKKLHQMKKEQVIPDELLTEEQKQKRQKNKKKTKRAAQKKKEKWYKPKINTFIYISGLPFDITHDELKQFASKAGVLRIDPLTNTEKIKIYKDDEGSPKGDAAISFLKEQSIELAIQNLNNSQIRSGFPVKIERAQFMQKDSDYKPRETKKQSKVNKIIAKKNQQKQLTWDQQVAKEGEGLKIVILKHIFTPQSLNDDDYIESVKKEMALQLGNIGQIQRIRFYEGHADGVVEVKFKNDKDAEQCLHLMNGRFYDGRQIICEYWDGETDYKKSTALDYQRIEQFGKTLEKLENIAEESGEEGSQQQNNKIQQRQNDIKSAEIKQKEQ